jgi:hypothetical protein
MLLVKMINGQLKYKMSYALMRMCDLKDEINSNTYNTAKNIFSKFNPSKNDETKDKISIGIKKFYEENPETREEMSKRMSGENNPNVKNGFSEEHRRNISKAKKGKIRSEETKKKISNTLKGKERNSGSNLGKRFSQETRTKMSISRQGVKKKLIICPVCGKEGGNNVMKRWHFDNCKHKK